IVGSVTVGDYNDDGRADLAVSSKNNIISVLLNTTTNFAITQPNLVGDFAGYGVQRFNKTTHVWSQLTPVDANLLAATPTGVVIGTFPGGGVHRFVPWLGFTQITPVNATALAMNASGTAVASFGAFGVHVFRPTTGWVQITPFAASAVAIDAQGDVVAN